MPSLHVCDHERPEPLACGVSAVNNQHHRPPAQYRGEDQRTPAIPIEIFKGADFEKKHENNGHRSKNANVTVVHHIENMLSPASGAEPVNCIGETIEMES